MIASWQVDRFLTRRDSCIIGRALAERMGMKLGDRVTLLGDIFPARLDLVVAGVYESAIDNEVLYFNNQYLKESLRKEQDYAIMLMVMVDDAESVTPVARRIDDLFHNATVQTKTETEKVFRLSFLSYVGNIKLFLFVVCASLAGTVLLVATNSITMLCLIAGEAMVVGAIGGLLGLVGAQVLIAAMRNLPVVMVSLTTLSLSPGIMAIELLLAAACGVVAAVPAAWRASRRPITECLAQAD